jgi:hypothetical protein
MLKGFLFVLAGNRDVTMRERVFYLFIMYSSASSNLKLRTKYSQILAKLHHNTVKNSDLL